MAWWRERDGKYDVYERVMADGKYKPKYMGTFPTAKLRDAKIRTLEEDKAINRHNLVDYDATLWKYCDRYVTAPVRREPGTLDVIRQSIRHIKRFFPENTRLRDIIEDNVEDFIKWFSEPIDDRTPINPKAYHRTAYNHTTTHIQLRNFKGILNYAIEKKVIPSNPAKIPLKKFGKPAGRDVYLSFNEQDRLLESALKVKMRKPNWNLMMWKMIKVLYATGVRRNELLNMRKEHMVSDFEIEIPSRTAKNSRSAALNATKSNDPYVMDLNDEIAPFFHEVKEGPIWPGWTKNSFNNQFRRVADAAGLEALVPHGMRHTLSKDMLQSGQMSLPELQAFLNHKDIHSTMVYNRWAKKERFRKQVNALIRPAKMLKVV